jgi:uncharacterized membrane-anchored protein YjiN (DUF445 family)
MSADTMLSPEEIRQRRSLRRHRWLATGLLVAMGGLFAATQTVLDGTAPWVGLLRAGSEAALIGGLADWFAVTALFRRPLGLPIPHTALIPRNKDRIARRLGLFVTDNFLAPDLVHGRLRALTIGGRAGLWLARPDNARRAAAYVADLVPPLLDSVDDGRLRALLQHAVTSRLRAADLAETLRQALAVVPKSDYDALLTQAATAGRDALIRHEAALEALIGERSRWWLPKAVDRRVARAVVHEVRDLLDDLGQPDHPLRRRLEAALVDLRTRAETDPAVHARVAALRDSLLGHPRVQRQMGRVWDEIRRLALSAAGRPESRLRGALADGFQALGRHLVEDAEARRLVDERLDGALAAVLVPWRQEIGAFIEDVVKRWDSRTATRRMELMVGKDLQYIRVNGTLVGGLIGCLLHLLTHAPAP